MQTIIFIILSEIIFFFSNKSLDHYNCHPSINSLQQIQQALDRIGNRNFPQFRPIYLSLYEYFRFFGDVSLYRMFYKIFSQNLNDPTLQKEFSIYYFHRQLNPTTPSSVENIIDRLTQHLFKVQREDFIFQATFFDEILPLQEYIKNSESFLPRQAYLRLAQKLKLNHTRYDELACFYHKVKKDLLASLQTHICLSIGDQFPIYIHQINKYHSIRECEEFLRESEEIQYYRNCKKCRFALSIMRLHCLHVWVLSNQPQDSRQILAQLHQYYKYVCKLAEDPECQQEKRTFKGVQVQVFLSHAIFSNFIWKDDSNYQSFRGFYQIIKHKKDDIHQEYTWVYFAIKNRICQILINEATLIGLFQNDSAKCLEYLQMLTDYFQKNQTENNYNIVLRSFQAFIKKLSEESRLNVYNLLRASKRTIVSKASFRVYFYVLAQYIQELSLQRSIFAFIAQSIQGITFGFQNHYSSEIHRHFVKELRRQGRQFTRQEFYLNNNLVKFFIRFSRLAVDKKRYPKCYNAKDKELVRKMKKIEGCFKVENEQTIIFSFQKKRRAKAKET